VKEFDPLIDPTVPFPPTRRISVAIGSAKPKAVVVAEAVYQILFRSMEEAKKKAADDHAKRMRDQGDSARRLLACGWCRRSGSNRHGPKATRF
jgi:hypothetical protein